MSDEKFKISKKDLAIFPPHIASFAISTMCIMVSHGLAAIIVFFSYLSIPFELAFTFLLLSSLPFVVLNLAVIKGHKFGVSGLKWLAILYFTIALSCFVVPEKAESDIGAAIVLLLSSFSAWRTVTST